jgi:hypothetical protein
MEGGSTCTEMVAESLRMAMVGSCDAAFAVGSDGRDHHSSDGERGSGTPVGTVLVRIRIERVAHSVHDWASANFAGAGRRVLM